MESRGRMGLSGPVIALILLVVGVALALVAAAIGGGFIFGWGGAAKVTIERVDILVNPETGVGYITVEVRNSGGARLTSCAVQLFDPSGSPVNTAFTGSPNIETGRLVTHRADSVSGLESGRIYTVTVTCQDPAGRSISDQKSAISHI